MTLPETNISDMSPEKCCLEDYVSFEMVPFLGDDMAIFLVGVCNLAQGQL